MDDVTQGAHQELKANKEELRVEKLKDKGRLEKALVEEEGKGKGLRV